MDLEIILFNGEGKTEARHKTGNAKEKRLQKIFGELIK